MKSSKKTFLLLLLLPAYVYGSYENELGFFGGASYYLGDLNPSRQFAMADFAIGGLYRINIDRHKSIRFSGYYGNVRADDAVIGYNKNRNLHFRSKIIEASFQLEINFLPYEPRNIDYNNQTPYLFGGIGGFHFNPQAMCDDGNWHYLQPLGTEGQNIDAGKEPYSLYAASFLFGMGYKINVSEFLRFGVEWGMRRTTTDYLDDVSTVYVDPELFSDEIVAQLADRSINNRGENAGMMRGNPNRKDWYSFAGVLITFKIPARKQTLHCRAMMK